MEVQGLLANIIETRSKVISILKNIFDPELPVNIWDLGLIYGVDIENNICTIIMTFTSPNCPSCEDIVGEIKQNILVLPEINTCNVDIVWEPVWNKNNLSEEVLLEIDMY
jgi:metal-sulfur cluster biosynthetic enzyme